MGCEVHVFLCRMEHIGQEIQQELRRQERSVAWFARQLHCDRTNIYDIFSRTNIDLQLLVRISRILHRNFLREWADAIDCVE